MNGHGEMEAAAALLFVRSQRDLGLALEQVNGLLALQRQRRCPQSEDEVLAVWFRPDLDSRLPTCLRAVDPDCTTGEKRGSTGILTIQDSFSLAGIWTLSWLGGPALRGARDRVEKQEAICSAFVELLSEPELVGSFCPVFGADRSTESALMDIKRLNERYLLPMGLLGFRQDPSRGVYLDEAVSQ